MVERYDDYVIDDLICATLVTSLESKSLSLEEKFGYKALRKSLVIVIFHSLIFKNLVSSKATSRVMYTLKNISR